MLMMVMVTVMVTVIVVMMMVMSTKTQRRLSYSWLTLLTNSPRVTSPTNSPGVVTVDSLGKNRMSSTKASHKAKVTRALSFSRSKDCSSVLIWWASLPNQHVHLMGG